MSKQSPPLAHKRAAPCRNGDSNKLTNLFLNLTLWRLLQLCGSPFRKYVGLYVISGRSVWALVVDVQRWIYRAVGWLSTPPTSVGLQRFGQPFLNGARRWHYALGEDRLQPLRLANEIHTYFDSPRFALCEVCARMCQDVSVSASPCCT